MAEPIHDKIKRSLQAAEGLYHRLVLLVGQTGSGKTGILRDLADEFGTSVINVNLALSSELLELTAKQRSLWLPEILDQITAGYFEKSGRSGFVERNHHLREAFVRRNRPSRVPQL